MTERHSATYDAKALAHPLRRRILEAIEALGGVASPNQIAAELKEPLGKVSYHVKTLLEYDWLELVRTEPRRGAVEHFYSRSSHAALQGSEAETLDRIAELALPGAELAAGTSGSALLADIRSLVEESGRAVG